MKCNDAGLEIIKQAEGLRLKAYKCPAGIWTIGYGHTKGVKRGDTCTICQAIKYLKEDIAWAEDCVNDNVIPLTENPFSALVSLVFNIGATKFLKSKVFFHVNNQYFRDYPEIFKTNYLRAFVTAGGVIMKGLIKRRQAEYDLWMKL